MTLSFATIRFFAVMRQTLKAPLLVRFPQKCVNPRNVKVSGFPAPRCFRFRTANRPNSIRRVLSGCNSRPNLTSLVPELRQEPLGVSSVLKARDKIVSITHDNYIAACDFLAPGLNPQVEHIVQVHVCEPWCNNCSLRSTHVRLRPLTIFRYSGL